MWALFSSTSESDLVLALLLTNSVGFDHLGLRFYSIKLHKLCNPLLWAINLLSRTSYLPIPTKIQLFHTFTSPVHILILTTIYTFSPQWIQPLLNETCLKIVWVLSIIFLGIHIPKYYPTNIPKFFYVLFTLFSLHLVT